MDRETKIKMLRAQQLGKQALDREVMAKDPENKEFWEQKLKSLEDAKKNLTAQLAEIEFCIPCYKDKIKTF